MNRFSVSSALLRDDGNPLNLLPWSIIEYMAEEKEEEKPCYLFPLKKTSTEDYSTISAKAVTGSILLRIKRLDLLCSISDVFELYQDEKSSIRTSSSSAMISRAAQGLRTPAPRSSSLPSQIQFWSCLGSMRHGLTFISIHCQQFQALFKLQNERERRKKRNIWWTPLFMISSWLSTSKKKSHLQQLATTHPQKISVYNHYEITIVVCSVACCLCILLSN